MFKKGRRLVAVRAFSYDGMTFDDGEIITILSDNPKHGRYPTESSPKVGKHTCECLAKQISGYWIDPTFLCRYTKPIGFDTPDFEL